MALDQDIPPRPLDVSRVLAAYAQNLQVQFLTSEQGSVVQPLRVFSPDGLLPAIAADAAIVWKDLSRPLIDIGSRKDILSSFYDGFLDKSSSAKDENIKAQISDQESFKEIGAVFNRSADSLLRISVSMSDVNHDMFSALRLMTFTYSARRLLNLREGLRINLSEVLHAWDQAPWDILLAIQDLDSENLQPTGSKNRISLDEFQLPIWSGFDSDFFANEFKPVEILKQDRKNQESLNGSITQNNKSQDGVRRG